jgi:hypothetical protein
MNFKSVGKVFTKVMIMDRIVLMVEAEGEDKEEVEDVGVALCITISMMVLVTMLEAREAIPYGIARIEANIAVTTLVNHTMGLIATTMHTGAGIKPNMETLARCMGIPKSRPCMVTELVFAMQP